MRGRVQGVGFRHFAARHGQALGLRGWVRNAADGSVRLVAEGSEESLRRFLDLLRQGPAWARVEDVEVSYDRARGEGPGFRIR